MIITPNTVNFLKPSGGWTLLWMGAFLIAFIASSQLVPLAEQMGAIKFPGCTEKLEACKDNQALAFPPKVLLGVGRVLDFVFGWPLLLGGYTPSEFWEDWRAFTTTGNPYALHISLILCSLGLLLYWYILSCAISGVGNESRQRPDIPLGF